MKQETKRILLSGAFAVAAVFCAHADITFTYTLADGAATITGASGIGTSLERIN